MKSGRVNENTAVTDYYLYCLVCLVHYTCVELLYMCIDIYRHCSLIRILTKQLDYRITF